MKAKGAFTYDVSKILANFTPPPYVYKIPFRRVRARPSAREQRYLAYKPIPMSATVSIERPPVMTSAFSKPPFQSDISFLKNPLHSTLIEALNVNLIKLKTERLGEYINAVVSRIVIGPLNLKQFLLKFKYFC